MVCVVVVVNIIRLVPTIHLCRYMTKPTTIQSIPQVNNNNNKSSSATAAVAFLVQSAITITYLPMAPLTFRLYRRYTFTCLPGYNIAIYPSTIQQRSRAATSSQEIVSYGRQLNLTRNYLQIGSSLLFVCFKGNFVTLSSSANQPANQPRHPLVLMLPKALHLNTFTGGGGKLENPGYILTTITSSIHGLLGCVLYFDVRRESAI